MGRGGNLPALGAVPLRPPLDYFAHGGGAAHGAVFREDIWPRLTGSQRRNHQISSISNRVTAVAVASAIRQSRKTTRDPPVLQPRVSRGSSSQRGSLRYATNGCQRNDVSITLLWRP